MNVNLMSALVTAIVFGLTTQATAQRAVALVEDVRGRPAGIEFMDYVSQGKVIKLGPQDSIVIGYMKSCVRETITGGTVTVGAEQSSVQFGSVERTTVPCDSAYSQLTEQQQGAVGGTVFRDLRRDEQSAPSFLITLYGTSPIVAMPGGGVLVIERVDIPGERHEIEIDKQALVRGVFYDLSWGSRALTPGGTYVARLGGRAQHFNIDPRAKPDSASIVGRLLRFD